jgi:hypothetical protein
MTQNTDTCFSIDCGIDWVLGIDWVVLGIDWVVLGIDLGIYMGVWIGLFWV